jgi:hypothetical protein
LEVYQLHNPEKTIWGLPHGDFSEISMGVKENLPAI